MKNDSVLKTLMVAGLLCVICSVLVAGSAVLLKERQTINKNLDIKKNILLACGKIKNSSVTRVEVENAFKDIETKLIDLNSGKEVTTMKASEYDQLKASKDPKQSQLITRDKNRAGIKRREKISKVYLVKENGVVNMIVLPINGKGLWSTLYGFIALSFDTKTVKGLTFYKHGETPGLGGEIDNAAWKESWKEKNPFDESGKPIIKVIKGLVAKNGKNSAHQIDGLSGATITSNGVTNLVQYWLGNNGFGPYLASLRGEL